MSGNNETLKKLREEVQLLEMKKELARLEAEEEASILGNSYAGKLTISSQVPPRPIMKPYRPEGQKPTADQYLKTKGKRQEVGMASIPFKQQRKMYSVPNVVGKGKQPAIILRKDESKTVTLRPENLIISQLTDFQKQLLSRLSPKHTGEVRAEIEKEFKRLNKTAPISMSIDATYVQAEINLEAYDVIARIKGEFFRTRVFSRFFFDLDEWEKIYTLLNSERTEFELLVALYGMQIAKLHESHIRLIKVGSTRLISVVNSIPAEIFKTFFNGGFLCSLNVSGSFLSMIKDLEPFNSYYIKTLALSKAGKKRVTKLEVISAPPLWQYSYWQCIDEVNKTPPCYFPSIHLFIENEYPEIHDIGNEVINHQDPNLKRRAEQLRKIKAVMGLKIFSILEDKERMIFLALEADASTYVSQELDNMAGWLYHQTLPEEANEAQEITRTEDTHSQSGSSAGTRDNDKMKE